MVSKPIEKEHKTVVLKKPCKISIREEMRWGGDFRPFGVLLGLPFAFLSLLISLVGALVWIISLLLTLTCPCCPCLTVLWEVSPELIKAPIHVMEWCTSIPC